jgi:REP-associated tyrosine transposase
MPNYRRLYVPGGTYFFTVVTAARRPILTTELRRRCLREAIEEVMAEKPFTQLALVLLPDHLHAVWVLPPGDDDFSSRWADLKIAFTKKYLAGGGTEAAVSASRRKKRERGVWQRRFWEHLIRDADELKRCVDYIHHNPLKHGLVNRVMDWPWSTFHRFLEQGEYPDNWGVNVEIAHDPNVFGPDEFM